MSARRVVVTGLGMVTPLGNTVHSTWENILAGKSGAALVKTFDTSAFSTRFAASVKDFDASEYLDAKEIRKLDSFIQFGVVAGMQAIANAGILIEKVDPTRCGIALGSGIGGLPNIERNYATYLKNGPLTNGPRKISPTFIPGAIINMVAGYLAIKCGFKGPNISLVTACTTGTHNIGEAARMIKYNDADVMVAGGSEMATCAMGIGGFAAMRALSTRNDNPTKASRPWDKDRDGFVLGDGAGVVVLEEYEHAKARGATIYGELAGFGMSCDAYHMSAPLPDGAGFAACMRNAVTDAKVNITDVNYINAHGTSTPIADPLEAAAVKTVFGHHAYKLAVSSTKSMTGHLLGAAGAIEAIFALLAIRDNVLPPTINLDNPDEGCDLNFVPHTPQSAAVDVVVSNSFGFGGTNASLVFKRVKG